MALIIVRVRIERPFEDVFVIVPVLTWINKLKSRSGVGQVATGSG